MKRVALKVAAIVLGICSVRAGGTKICFEAESSLSTEPPMIVVTNGVGGASNNVYLEIPEGAGNPPKRVAGKAAYTLDVLEEGLFILWCRVWWEGECSNSFTMGFDDQPTFLFGEDATYKAWHWVKYPVARTAAPIKLSKGKHTLTIYNREDGVRLDQLLLSSDKRFVPVDTEHPGSRQ